MIIIVAVKQRIIVFTFLICFELSSFSLDTVSSFLYSQGT